jgi:hypothetical protein
MVIHPSYTLHITEDNFYVQPFSTDGSNDVLFINRLPNGCGLISKQNLLENRIFL